MTAASCLGLTPTRIARSGEATSPASTPPRNGTTSCALWPPGYSPASFFWASETRTLLYLTCESVNSDTSLPCMRVGEFRHCFTLHVNQCIPSLLYTLHVSQWITTLVYLTCESVNYDTSLPYMRVSEFRYYFTLHVNQCIPTLFLPYMPVSEFRHHHVSLHASQWIIAPL